MIRERKLYGATCHLCADLLGPSHDVEPVWPVAHDECPRCSFCQENAFMGAFIRAAGGHDLFAPEVREACNALRRGLDHPLLAQLRDEMRADVGEGLSDS